MTKLVKMLVIGGSSTAVVGGAGAGVGVAVANKKESINQAKAVAKQTTQVTKQSTEVAKSYAVPTAIPQEVPMLIPSLVPQQVAQSIPMAIPKGMEGQLIPTPIPAEVKGETPILAPKGMEGQVDPVAVIKPTVPAGGLVFGGHSQEATPPLKGTYQTHEGIHHLALDSDMQLIPELPQAEPQAVPQQVPHQVVKPTVPAGGLVFGGHSQEVTPPLQGTYQTHEGIHHLALDSDMQLIPETPAHPVLPQAIPYVVPAMQQEVYKNTLGDPYIQNELVSQNVAAVVWTVEPQATPYLHITPEAKFALPSFSGIRETAPVKIENPEVFSGTAYAVPTMEAPAIHIPTPTPSLIPNMVPSLVPSQSPILVPEQIGKVPAIDWYATAYGHDGYAVPKPVEYRIPMLINKYVDTQTVLKDGMRTEPIPTPSKMVQVPRLIIVPKLVVPTTYLVPEQKPLVPYVVPKLISSSEEAASSNEETFSIDPASKLAAAHIVGAANQPYFETFVATPVVSSSVDLATESSFGATYHAIEGINHAAYFNGVLQQTPSLAPSATPNLAPSAVPYLVPTLGPVVAPVLAPQGDHVHPSFGADTTELSMPTPVDTHANHIYGHHQPVQPQSQQVAYTGNSIIDSLIKHIHEGMSVLDASKQVFREVAWGQHNGYQGLNYQNMYEILSQHVQMHQDQSQHVSLTMNDFRDAFNHGFEAVRHESGFEGHFSTLDACHTFLLHR